MAEYKCMQLNLKDSLFIIQILLKYAYLYNFTYTIKVYKFQLLRKSYLYYDYIE